MRVFLSLLALLACGLPAQAQTLNVIYLGKGQVLEALPPRQLSLNAHIGEFQYQPGGHAIAYTGGQVNMTPGHILDSSMTYFVKVVGVTQGAQTTLLTNTSTARQMLVGIPPEDIAKAESQMEAAYHQNPAVMGNQMGTSWSIQLRGWNGDGRYLFATNQVIVPLESRKDSLTHTQVLRFDIGISPPAQTEVGLPEDATGNIGTSVMAFQWSPQHRLLLFRLMRVEPGVPVLGETNSPRPKVSREVQIYNPNTGTLTLLPSPEGFTEQGWPDETHLLFEKRGTGAAKTYVLYDLATRQLASIPKPAKMPSTGTAWGEDTLPSPISPTNAAFSFQVQSDTIIDSQKVSKQDSRVLWLRRTPAKLPLSALPVGLTPGDADPKPQWSPTGKQIAFLAHGDLFVTDLIVRPASSREKLAVGEPLTCAEERGIAVPNLKQIALAIIMYAQDNNEKYPAAEGFREAVMPYLKDDSLFQIGKIPFVYRGKGESLASMAAPSEFVLGTMDLPCAQIVVYGDGHVKAINKTPPSPQ